MDLNTVSRRRFLGVSAAGAAALIGGCRSSGRDGAAAARGGSSVAPGTRPSVDVAFWQVSDTHFLCDVEDVAKIDDVSARVNAEVVRLLNALPGTQLPEHVGGGTLPRPIGVIHTGDVIDSGDKYSEPYRDMQRREWDAYEELYGLTGSEGTLKYPVYELYGNHDAPKGYGLALDKMVERNKKRPGVNHVSKNGVHYSWDWGPIHFATLGINVGDTGRTSRPRSFNSLGSYEWLNADLKQHVGESGRPVVLCHHVDMAGHTNGCDPAKDLGKGRIDWDPCDVQGFFDAIRGYNVVACIYGHTHARNVFLWDGKSAKADAGINVFNCDDAAHFRGGQHGILHYHLTADTLTVREFATKDHWKTAAWTQAWVKKISMKGGAVAPVEEKVAVGCGC